VTPMAELAPQGGVNLLPAGATEGDAYIQKTSLAADKPPVLQNFSHMFYAVFCYRLMFD